MIIDGSHDGMTMRAARTHGCLKLEAQAFHVDLGDLTQFVAALYEAAGKPAPVILERPATSTLIHGPNQWVKVAPSPAGHPSNVPGVLIEVANGIRLIGDEPLRVALALIDAMREAENDPDPSEVTALAEEIRSDVSRIGGNPTEAFEIAARTALRWMREREATS